MKNTLKKFSWNDIEIEDDNNDISKSSFHITKADADKRLVFGWALVSATADGQKIIDHQGDIVEQDELENGAYEYVLNFRDAGEEHNASLRKKARMVESVVFTEEKLKAMGIPAGTVPYGWWIGFYVDDDKTWELIKNGTYKMFSIEGRAVREPVNEPLAKSFSELIEKFNPYHDSKGRFTSAGAATSFTYAPGRSKAHDLAIAREKERTANAAGANNDGGKERIAAAESKMKGLLKDDAEVNLAGMDPDLAESTASSVEMVLNKYPSVKDAFGGFDTNGEFEDNTMAYYSVETKKIHLNKEYYSDKQKFEEKYSDGVEKQFHPAGTNANSVVVHEMGHAIDRYVSLKTIDYWKVNLGGETVSARIWNTDIRAAKKKGEPLTGKIIRDNLSGYAGKNPKEYFAEAFAESMTSAAPRKTAQSIVKRMETYIKKAESK